MTELAKHEQPPAPEPASEASALISMIERSARDPNVDIDKMERLFLMQQSAMERRAKAAYLAALSDMQADMPAAVKRGKAHNDKAYARFEDIIAAVRPVLVKYGFSLTFRTAQDDKSICVTGVLGHAEGHSESTDIVLPPDTSGNKNIVQAWGSSTSYGKRYVALTLLGIATEGEDDDGKAAATALITDEQATELRELIAAASADIDAVLAFHKIESLSDMPARDFQKSRSMLLARKAKLEKEKQNA
jgi:hypothetical protein